MEQGSTITTFSFIVYSVVPGRVGYRVGLVMRVYRARCTSVYVVDYPVIHMWDN